MRQRMIRESFCISMGIPIKPATQGAGQADGVSKLETVGETHFTIRRNGRKFTFDGLVVGKLSDDVLAGMPFLYKNDVGIRPFKNLIIIGGTEKVRYDNKGRCDPMVRRSVSHVLKAPSSRSVVLPGESLEVKTPENVLVNSAWAVEPRFDHTPFQWFEHQEIMDLGQGINLVNTSDEPVIIPKNAHVAQIRQVTTISSVRSVDAIPTELKELGIVTSELSSQSVQPMGSKLHSDCISINPGNLVSSDVVQSVRDIHRMYDSVFRPEISQYNGHSGKIECHINMGSAQRKARFPQYDHEKMVLLQKYFDDLEKQGVLNRRRQE